uniref:Uncharacterized protein n=1 Tax=Cacopsylla melanoneura TaxID=428564 RepID=A0A8D8US96_9HEMI
MLRAFQPLMTPTKKTYLLYDAVMHKNLRNFLQPSVFQKSQQIFQECSGKFSGICRNDTGFPSTHATDTKYILQDAKRPNEHFHTFSFPKFPTNFPGVRSNFWKMFLSLQKCYWFSNHSCYRHKNQVQKSLINH